MWLFDFENLLSFVDKLLFLKTKFILAIYLFTEAITIHTNSIFLWYCASTHSSKNNSLSLFWHWLAVLHGNVLAVKFRHFPTINWLFVTSVIGPLQTCILVSITVTLVGIICFTIWIINDTLKSWIYKNKYVNA